MSIKQFLLQFFTWWNGQTLGTRLLIWRRGEFVGEDEFGNRYYRQRGGSRRWVVYDGEADGSKVPPGWHGWLAHRIDTPPARESYVPRPWQRPHMPNQTGTAPAYLPRGSLMSPSPRASGDGDYEAWRPDR